MLMLCHVMSCYVMLNEAMVHIYIDIYKNIYIYI